MIIMIVMMLLLMIIIIMINVLNTIIYTSPCVSFSNVIENKRDNIHAGIT